MTSPEGTAEPVGAVRLVAAARWRLTGRAFLLALVPVPVAIAVGAPVWGWTAALTGVVVGFGFTAALYGALTYARTGSPSLGWEPEGLRFRLDGITVVANWATLKGAGQKRSRRYGALDGIVVGHTRAYRHDGMTLDGRDLERLDRSGFDAFVPLSLFGGKAWRDGPVGAAFEAYRPDVLH